MKHLKFFALTCIATFMLSCNGKNSKEGEVTIDSTKSVVINFQPEYYFSGKISHTADTTLFEDFASGTTFGVQPNRALEELIQACDSIADKNADVTTQIRGYLYSTGKDKNVPKMLYMTHIEGIKTEKAGNRPTKIAGSYERATDKVILKEDHTCTINLGNSGKEGEWYMSNDTLIYITSGSDSYLFDANPNGKEIRMHKDHDFVLTRK